MAHKNNPHANTPTNAIATTTITSGAVAANHTFAISNANATSYGLTGASGTITIGGSGCAGKRSPPPTNWSVVKVTGRHHGFMDNEEVYEAPVTGQRTWIGSLNISNSCGSHHWKLFTRLYPNIEFLTCGIPDTDKAHETRVSNIMFLNEEDFDFFENWFAEYTTLFGTKENLYSYRFPPPPAVMERSYQVPLAKHDDLTQAAEWLMINCTDKVYFLGELLFFLNDEDATLYKLRFESK